MENNFIYLKPNSMGLNIFYQETQSGYINLLKSESRAFKRTIMGTVVHEMRHTCFNTIFAFIAIGNS